MQNSKEQLDTTKNAEIQSKIRNTKSEIQKLYSRKNARGEIRRGYQLSRAQVNTNFFRQDDRIYRDFVLSQLGVLGKLYSVSELSPQRPAFVHKAIKMAFLLSWLKRVFIRHGLTQIDTDYKEIILTTKNAEIQSEIRNTKF